MKLLHSFSPYFLLFILAACSGSSDPLDVKAASGTTINTDQDETSPANQTQTNTASNTPDPLNSNLTTVVITTTTPEDTTTPTPTPPAPTPTPPTCLAPTVGPRLVHLEYVKAYLLSAENQNTHPSTDAFIRQVYLALLTRDASDGDVAAWSQVVIQGGTRADIVAGIFLSAEARGIRVDQLYQRLLHRCSDPTGRTAWSNAFGSGMSEAAVISNLLLSGEYLGAHATDADFVRGLYVDLLSRAASDAEVNSWVGAIAGGTSRLNVIRGILGSQEFANGATADYFQVYLGRAGATAEIQGNAATLQSYLAADLAALGP